MHASPPTHHHSKSMNKNIIIAGFLGVVALSAIGQNTATKTWIPFVNGAPVPGVAGNSTQAFCESGNAARAITAPTIYECRYVQRVEPPASAPAPAPAPAASAPAPAPAPTGSWVTGQSTAAEPTTARPAKGLAAPDPSYKTLVYRVTDASEPPTGMRVNDYSRRQAFSAGNKYQLVVALDGSWHIYDAITFAYVKRLPGLSGDAEPQWHPTNPDLMYYLPTNGVGMRILELNVTTGATRTIGDLGTRLKAKWPGAAAAWTRSEGSPSADGRYWCLQVDNASWGGVGVVTWDRDTDTILGYYNSSERPDHVSMSPSGRYCVVSSTGALGTVSFTRDFTSSRKLSATSEHSDIALMPNGEDMFVSVSYQSDAGDVYMHNLDTGERTVLFPSYLSGSSRAFHFSAKSFSKPGYVLISAYADAGGMKWMDRKITLVELKANPVVRNVAWHRSKYPSSEGYYHESHASISRDGTRVAFSSNWGGATLGDLHAYQALLFPY